MLTTRSWCLGLIRLVSTIKTGSGQNKFSELPANNYDHWLEMTILGNGTDKVTLKVGFILVLL